MALVVVARLTVADASSPAARVNGAVIGTERLERYFEEHLASMGRHLAAIRDPAVYRRLRRDALDELIAQELLWQEARDVGLTASDADVRIAVGRVRQQFKSEEGFRRNLAKAGFDERGYAEYVRRQLAIERLVAERIHPKPPAEPGSVQRAVQEHVRALRAGAKVEVLVP